jgi:hypothetical protein
MRPKVENGDVIPGWESATVPGYCNACGSEGWELVSAVNDPSSDKASVIDLIFKRPVQPGANSDILRKMPSGGSGSNQAEDSRTA